MIDRRGMRRNQTCDYSDLFRKIAQMDDQLTIEKKERQLCAINFAILQKELEEVKEALTDTENTLELLAEKFFCGNDETLTQLKALMKKDEENQQAGIGDETHGIPAKR